VLRPQFAEVGVLVMGNVGVEDNFSCDLLLCVRLVSWGLSSLRYSRMMDRRAGGPEVSEGVMGSW